MCMKSSVFAVHFHQTTRRCAVAIEQQETGTAANAPVVSMTARATDKLKEVIAKQDRDDLALRVYVTQGGCSGFSYGMTFAEGREEDDTLSEQYGVRDGGGL